MGDSARDLSFAARLFTLDGQGFTGGGPVHRNERLNGKKRCAHGAGIQHCLHTTTITRPIHKIHVSGDILDKYRLNTNIFDIYLCF